MVPIRSEAFQTSLIPPSALLQVLNTHIPLKHSTKEHFLGGNIGNVLKQPPHFVLSLALASITLTGLTPNTIKCAILIIEQYLDDCMKMAALEIR